MIRNEHAEHSYDLYSKVHHFVGSKDSKRALCGIAITSGPYTQIWPKRRRVFCIGCRSIRAGDGDMLMGPIERELRSGSVHLANWDVTDAAMSLCSGAADWLGYKSMQDAYNHNAWPDVLTEAICAAEHQCI